MSYRFAIVGCGRIASRHAEQIAGCGDLVAVCDSDLNKAVMLADRYGVKAYNDIHTLLKTVHPDVTIVCTPNGLHANHAIVSLRSGSHVLCEKPLCLTLVEGRAMIEAAGQSAKKLFVVKQNRYNEPVMYVKGLLDSGKLGHIHGFQINCFWNRPPAYYANSWRGTKALDGGILFTQFSHFVDLLYWFLGEIESASGWRANYMHKNLIDIEDAGAATLLMKSGALGTISYTINSFEKNMEGSLALFGDKGTVRIGGQYLNRLDHFAVQDEMMPRMGQGQPANQYGHYEGSMSNHHLVYEHLIKALDDPHHPFLEAREALKSVEMIRQIYDASPFAQESPDH